MHTRQRSVVQFYSAPTVQFLSALDIQYLLYPLKCLPTQS